LKNSLTIFLIEEEIFLCTLLEVKDPISCQESIDSPNYKAWMDAMRNDMNSMTRNKV